MDKFVPKEKMSKKAKKQTAAEKRKTWAFSPVTRKIDSKKVYNRKKISRAGYDDGAGVFLCSLSAGTALRGAGQRGDHPKSAPPR